MRLKTVIIALGFLASISLLPAQVLLFNGGTVIHVQDSVLLCVQGSYKAENGNTAPGIIKLAGDMVLEGDWINNSSGPGFSLQDTGTVSLVGISNPQTILGSSITIFPNLILARPGEGKETLLQSNCESFGKLDLQDDVLNTRDFSFYLSNPQPNALQRLGGNESPFPTSTNGGYIVSSDGYFSRSFSPDFNFQSYLFPVGSAARWQPVTISADLDSSNIYSVRFVDEPPPGLASLSEEISAVNPDWYHLIWRIGPDANENIRIFFDPLASDICDPDEVTVSQYPSGKWEPLENVYSYQGGLNMASTEIRKYPYYNSNAFFNPYFALAGKVRENGSPSCAFPPELLQLSIIPQENSFLLQWETEPKPNLSGYLIGRSEDGITFHDHGWKEASNSTAPTVVYSQEDADVIQNQRYFYRLEEQDINGASKLSNVVEAILLGDQPTLIGNVFPNPSNGEASIWLSTQLAMDIELNLINDLGQVIQETQYSIDEGYQVIQLNSSPLSAGMYLVQIKYRGGQSIRKWLVQ